MNKSKYNLPKHRANFLPEPETVLNPDTPYGNARKMYIDGARAYRAYLLKSSRSWLAAVIDYFGPDKRSATTLERKITEYLIRQGCPDNATHTFTLEQLRKECPPNKFAAMPTVGTGVFYFYLVEIYENYL